MVEVVPVYYADWDVAGGYLGQRCTCDVPWSNCRRSKSLRGNGSWSSNAQNTIAQICSSPGRVSIPTCSRTSPVIKLISEIPAPIQPCTSTNLVCVVAPSGTRQVVSAMPQCDFPMQLHLHVEAAPVARVPPANIGDLEVDAASVGVKTAFLLGGNRTIPVHVADEGAAGWGGGGGGREAGGESSIRSDSLRSKSSRSNIPFINSSLWIPPTCSRQSRPIDRLISICVPGQSHFATNLALTVLISTSHHQQSYPNRLQEQQATYS